MQKPMIVAIRRENTPRIHKNINENTAHAFVGSWVIYKFRPYTHSPINKPMRHKINTTALYMSEIVYDVCDKKFVKSRYSHPDETPFDNMPTTLEKVFKPIVETCYLTPYETLIENYHEDDINRAIYLTDSYNDYIENIDELKYHYMRFKFGNEISNDIMNGLKMKYPEKLI